MSNWFRSIRNTFHVKTQIIKKKTNNNQTKASSLYWRAADEYLLASFCSADTKEWMHTCKMTEVPLVWKKKPYGKYSFFNALNETALFSELMVSA